MKKQYVEPKMIVEDFAVSEMVAANCTVTPVDITVVSEMSSATPPCKGLQEYVGTPQYDVYFMLDDAYHGEFDADRDGHHQSKDGTYDKDDVVFTSAYREASKNSDICLTDPFEKGFTFVENFMDGCKSSDSPLINS